jgi:hypothetical protein
MSKPRAHKTPSMRIDPALLDQLASSESGAEAQTKPSKIEAVFSLRHPDEVESTRVSKRSSSAGQTSKSEPSPEQVEETVRRIIERVEEQTGKHVDDLNVFRYLNSFVVAADPVLIESLLKEPEIASAVSNRQPGEADLLGD